MTFENIYRTKFRDLNATNTIHDHNKLIFLNQKFNTWDATRKSFLLKILKFIIIYQFSQMSQAFSLRLLKRDIFRDWMHPWSFNTSLKIQSPITRDTTRKPFLLKSLKFIIIYQISPNGHKYFRVKWHIIHNLSATLSGYN